MSPPLISKETARYTKAGGKEHCSLCRHFSPRRGGRCARVLGDISPMGWCKLFSREMRGLVADASSFNGGGGGPALALDFMVPGTLDPRITFTRASTGTYFDSAGVMQTAAINAPRWDYDPVTLQLRGLLLEDQRTNLVLHNADLSQAVWVKQSTGGPVAPVVAVDQTTAPDGTLTADSVTFPAVSVVNGVSQLLHAITVTAAVYTFSVYLKGSIGGEQIYLYYRVSAYTVPVRITLTTQWQRFVVTTTTLTSAVCSFYVGCDLRDTQQSAIAAQTIYMWGAQVELGDFATSYIPTTATAVTRSIDSCLIPPANMSPWFVSPGGSWFAEFRYFDSTPTNSPRVIGRSDLGAGGVGPLFIGPTNQIGQFEPSAPAVTSATVVSANTAVKAVSSWAPGQMKVCVGGGAIATGATTVAGFGIFTTSGVSLMSNPTTPPANNYTTGHLRAVRYWPTVLSDASMQAMTA